MKKLLVAVTLCGPVCLMAANVSNIVPAYYGLGLCASPQFECIKVGHGQTWEKMFPNEGERDIVQRINRSYNYLWTGKEIVVPRDLAHVTLLDVAPL